MGVIWNQWARPISSENWVSYNSENMSVTFDSGIATCEWLVQEHFFYTALKTIHTTVFPIGDKYYCSYMINPSVSDLSWGIIAGNVAKYYAATNVPANTWTQVSTVVTNARATDNYYYINDCSSNLADISIGMIAQNKCPIFVNLTQMFGAGKEPTKKQFEAMCALNHIDLTSALPYDEGTEIDWIDSVPSVYELRRRIILNEPHLITPAAAPLQNFVTDLKAPLKECKVSFLPVQEGSGDPSPSNVRPISGWTGTILKRESVDILDKETYMPLPKNTRYIDFTNGKSIIWSNAYHCSDYIPINPNTDYVLHAAFFAQQAGAAFYDSNKIYISGFEINSQTNTTWRLITPSNAAYLRFCSFVDVQYSIDWDYNKISLNSVETFPVDWTNDAGEIFGGYVDLAKGELVEEWTAKHVKDWTWHVYSQWSIWYIPFSSASRSSNSRDISDKLVSFQGYDWNSAPLDSIISGNNSSMFIKHTGATSATEFNNWLAEVDPIVVYKRGTPIIHTLTPLQIKTLLGTNNIYTNTNGDVQVTYWKH